MSQCDYKLDRVRVHCDHKSWVSICDFKLLQATQINNQIQNATQKEAAAYHTHVHIERESMHNNFNDVYRGNESILRWLTWHRLGSRA